MEHWWNDTDRRKPKYKELNLSWCHFLHHKSHITGLASNTLLPASEAGN